MNKIILSKKRIAGDFRLDFKAFSYRSLLYYANAEKKHVQIAMLLSLSYLIDHFYTNKMMDRFSELFNQNKFLGFICSTFIPHQTIHFFRRSTNCPPMIGLLCYIYTKSKSITLKELFIS